MRDSYFTKKQLFLQHIGYLLTLCIYELNSQE